MESLLRTVRKIIPQNIFQTLQPTYHLCLAFLGALIYGFPSRKIKVVAITGTKGKTSTAELVNSILEAAGQKTALAGTLRFKVGDESRPNLYKMTMPGRIFMQSFLSRAVAKKCDWAVIEMTSEGAKQFRHKFIDLDALIFTNLAPEHIESHGSYEEYLAAKLSLARALNTSPKKNKAIISNTDDKEGHKFIEAAERARPFPFTLRDAGSHKLNDEGVELVFEGEKIVSPLRGLFNIYNIMAAATFAKSQNIPPSKIKAGVEKIASIRGRAEEIKAGQKFPVVVDYAHTPDSLRAIYEAYAGKKKICVLGSTGGGRDKWKRAKMGEIADEECAKVILTNEDPYDENPLDIVKGVASGMTRQKPEIIMDRRQAIRKAVQIASSGNTDGQGDFAVIITGKGTDPYIMEANGKKTPWSDARVAREEVEGELESFDRAAG